MVDLSQFKIWTPEEFEQVFMPAPAAKPNGAGTPRGDGDGHSGPHTIEEASVPDDLMDLIRDGVSGTKDRSRAFMHAVGRLKDHGATVDGVTDLMSRYPDGIASKYLRPKNRLRREIERAYDKLPDAPSIPPVSPGGAGAAPGLSLGLPIIEVRQGRIAAVIEEAEAALIACGVPIFERAGVLVEPIVSTLPASHRRETDVVLLRRLAPENVIYLLNRYAAGFAKWDVRKKDLVAINPPREIAMGLLAKGRWRFPNVAGVITTPTMRPDGSLLVEPGYDKATQLYLMPDRGLGALAIPDEPSRNDALAALAFLDALLDEFPFVTPIDRSVGLSALMAPVLRGAFDVGPFHLFRAPRMGSGKSYLMEIVSTIVSGQACPVIAYVKSREEMEKRLGALILEGATIISLDNVEEDVGGELLCMIATQQTIKIRILGLSEMKTCRWRGMIGGNGNNINVRSDMARRTLIANLDAGLERPEQRRFRSDPVGLAGENRGAYVAAILTIARAWRVAETQGALRGAGTVAGATPLASYSEWSKAVRLPLVWLGREDPVKSMDEAFEDDPERAQAKALFELTLELLPSVLADGSSAVFDARKLASAAPGDQALYALLLGRCAEWNGSSLSAPRIGLWLKRLKNQIHGGLKLEVVDKNSRDGARYRIVPVPRPAGVAGVAGVVWPLNHI
jgi:putative DNA primase/helicase